MKLYRYGQVCPGCKHKDCGIWWHSRKNLNSPCDGTSSCGIISYYEPVIGEKIFYTKNLNAWIISPKIYWLKNYKTLLKECQNMLKLGDDDGYWAYRIEELNKLIEGEATA